MTDERLRIVARLNELRFFQLGNTKVTDAGMESLRGLTLLIGLDLSGTRITDKGLVNIEGLRQLQLLQLQHTTITDAGLEHLRGLSRLEDLFLQDTKVTGAGVAKLKTALPNLRVVYSHKSATAANSASDPVADGETARYVLAYHEGSTLKPKVFVIDAAPAMEMVAGWVANNRDALEMVSFSKGHITMALLGDELIQLKKDGQRVRYTLRNNIYAPYPRSYDDTIEDVLSGEERNAIEGIFRKNGRQLDKVP